MRRWWVAAGAVVLVLGLVTGGLWVFLTPDHRTTFLVDASESADFGEVADAVGAAASNMSSDDSLALRKFGGSCDSANTSELVTPGTGQAAKIGEAARAITPSGKATLLNGILAAIDDFARTYPFRGSMTNRVVVVARGGADACGKSADEVRRIIADHTARAGVKIDFRFVGHRLTPEQVRTLNDIAAAADARQPRLTKTSAELVTTMKEVSIPADLVAQEIKTSPCDSVTPETLAAAHPLGPDVRYFGIKCQQDRFVLASANTTPRQSDDLLLVFELKDEKWQNLSSGTSLPCGTVPQEVWKQWEMPCEFEAVICRDGESKVTDLDGVGCSAAIDIADRYSTAVEAGQAQGQGLFWDAAEWSCAWPYEDGLAHAQVPWKCVRTTDHKVVQIGDYQR
jgi:hypothetical protein